MRLDSRLLLIPFAALVLALVALSALTRGFILLDTYDVLFGSAAASRCLGDGTFSGCNVGQFALLQYLPALVFHQVGFSLDAAANGLVTLNGLAVLGTVFLVARTVGRVVGSGGGAIAAAIIVASPLLWYAHGGYGEPLGALAITGFVAALLTGAAPWVIGATMFVAAISKETAVVFLVLLAAVAWMIRGRAKPLPRAELVSIAVAGAGAVLVNTAFNLFRYGTVTNTYYTNSAYQARPREAAANLAALVASPTGGLLWMWPAVIVAVGTVGVVAARRRRLREPGLAVAAFLCLLLVAVSQWYGPLGGTTWGPRLLLPWLPALLILAAVAYPSETRALLARGLARSRVAPVVLAAGLIVAGLPHIAVTVDSAKHRHAPPGIQANRDEIVVQPYLVDATCPTQPAADEDRDYYVKCLEHRNWHKGFAPARAYAALGRPLVLAFAILLAAAVAGLVAYARAWALRQLPTLA